jgi:ligand-binding sensor domain-containing protein
LKKLLLILLPGLLYFLQLPAQHQPFFHNVTETEGLADNRVTCIYQDRTGYTWIGTENGLNKFNGRSFTIYRSLPGKHQILPGSYINAVSQDHKGDMWVATRSGLNRIDAHTDSTEIVNASLPEHVQLPFEHIWDVYPENDTAIWIAIDTKQLLCYNPSKKKLKGYNFRQFLAANKIEYTPRYHSIFKIIPYSSTELWLATTEGIFRFNKQTGNFLLVYGVALDRISYFSFETASGKLYCADERNLLYVYHSKDRKMVTVDLGAARNKDKAVLPYTAGKNGLFIPAPEGLAWINGQDEVASFIVAGKTDAQGLLPGRITVIFKDKKGISWIGTEKGLSRFVPSLNAILRVSLPKNLQYDNAYALRNFIYNINRNEWLISSHSDNTIWRLNNQTGKLTPFKRPAAYNDTCYAFYAKHPDTLFLLCNNSLLTYYYSSNRWKRLALPYPWNQGTLTCMTIDGVGNYWLGTRRKGIFVFDPARQMFWSPPESQLNMSIIHAIEYDPVNGKTVRSGTYREMTLCPMPFILR